jgi:hypothetical protein
VQKVFITALFITYLKKRLQKTSFIFFIYKFVPPLLAFSSKETVIICIMYGQNWVHNCIFLPDGKSASLPPPPPSWEDIFYAGMKNIFTTSTRDRKNSPARGGGVSVRIGDKNTALTVWLVKAGRFITL